MSSESETGKIRKSTDTRVRKSRAPSKRKEVREKAAVRQFVRFSLDNEEYGIDVHLVDEIRRSTGIVETADKDATVCGSITIHDQPIAVIDVRSCLGYPARPVDSGTRIILVRHDGHVSGMLVDTVSEVVRVGKDAQTVNGKVFGPVDSGLISEIFLLDDRPVAVLDWPKVLGR